MILNDRVQFVGQFSFKAYQEDGTVDIYEDKNLIMDLARESMARLIGDVSVGTAASPINKFVLGTLGHVGTDILTNKQVGSDGFISTRTELFSEEDLTAYNYQLPFVPTGDVDITVNATGTMYSGSTAGAVDGTFNTVQRVVAGRNVSYIITIPTANANTFATTSEIIAYTEAALYAGTEIFAMKTFPAKVKENTVKFEITWTILF